MSGKSTKSGQQPANRPRGVTSRHDAPYERGPSPKGNVICDGCGIYFRGGRWIAGVPPLGDESTGLCPACRRVRDGDPAGTVHVPRLGDLTAEVRRMIQNAENAEREEHPLERLMAVEAEADGLRITTTGVHLARRIANALERRLHRQGHFRYADGEQDLMVEFD